MEEAPDPLTWLYGLQHSGVKLGLDGIRRLLALLDHPERAFPSILVGGTNGKGSTAATLDALLAAHGVRAGLYTSPHLVRPNERIRVAGADLEDAVLLPLLEELRRRIAGGLREGRLLVHPSFFEVVTAAALESFRRAAVAVAVLEVGLGGRLDATNAVDAVVSTIVGVDLDHVAILGDTLGAIAAEKAGIVKEGKPVVSGIAQPEARAVLAETCRARGAVLRDALRETEARADDSGAWSAGTPERTYHGLRPALPGEHQLHNLRVALLTLETVAPVLGLTIDPDRVRLGVAAVRWPGRLQRLPGNPPLLLDGAHNPAGARALAAELERTGLVPVLLLGAMRDKLLPDLLAPLVPRVGPIVLTQPRVLRAAEPELLAAALPAGTPTILEKDLPRALEIARETARERGTVVLVTGSLYLVGEVLGLLEGRAVPGPVSL
jgi:dihydrofolate synthase/folylpolyglutamate synthase